MDNSPPIELRVAEYLPKIVGFIGICILVVYLSLSGSMMPQELGELCKDISEVLQTVFSYSDLFRKFSFLPIKDRRNRA